MRHAIIGLVAALALVVACTGQSAGGQGNPTTNSNDNAVANANDNSTENDNQTTTNERFTLVTSTVGGGTVEPAIGTFAFGEEVTLTATPNSGWRFDRWEGDVESEEPVIAVTVIGDTELTAFFVKLATPPPDNTNDNADNANDNSTANDNSSTTGPGDDFDSATPLTLDASDRATVQATLVLASDVHVYDLGSLALGDRFTASCQAAGGSLDPLIALFDADGFRVFWNDDVDLEGGDFDSAINDLVRHSSNQYFIAVTSTDFAETTGPYVLTVEVDRGAGTPSISGHTIVIDFDGATNVTIAGMDFGSPAPFDAAAIDPVFAGQTTTMKQNIVTIVRADFAAFDLSVLSTDDPAPAAPFTSVFMGEDNDELLGIANTLDFYNAEKSDNVIVFTQAFDGLTFSVAEMSQAIANVVSHEVGHSLGLMHTLDGTELMDNSGSDLPLLDDQSFGTATVDDFPIGQQNAPLLLNESLGPAAKRSFPSGSGPRCGTCGLPLEKLIRPRSSQEH